VFCFVKVQHALLERPLNFILFSRFNCIANRTSLIDVLGTALLVVGFWALGYGKNGATPPPPPGNA
jgi:hypothetical protein